MTVVASDCVPSDPEPPAHINDHHPDDARKLSTIIADPSHRNDASSDKNMVDTSSSSCVDTTQPAVSSTITRRTANTFLLTPQTPISSKKLSKSETTSQSTTTSKTLTVQSIIPSPMKHLIDDKQILQYSDVLKQ